MITEEHKIPHHKMRDFFLRRRQRVGAFFYYQLNIIEIWCCLGYKKSPWLDGLFGV